MTNKWTELPRRENIEYCVEHRSEEAPTPLKTPILKDDDGTISNREFRTWIAMKLVGGASRDIMTAWRYGVDQLDENDKELLDRFRRLWSDASDLYHKLMFRLDDIQKEGEEDEEEEEGD